MAKNWSRSRSVRRNQLKYIAMVVALVGSSGTAFAHGDHSGAAGFEYLLVLLAVMAIAVLVRHRR